MPKNVPTSEIYTVSQLNRQVARLLESEFYLIQVEGEISNLSIAASGHWYFTLKDEQAQVSAAMFKGRNRLVRFKPENGMKVIVRTKVSLYAPRGNYQLIAENMQEAGVGNLQQQFERLKEKLKLEGLFDPEHKQELPPTPVRMAVITSPTGAAIRDILHIMERRSPGIEIVIIPTVVQGNEATTSICQAIHLADSLTGNQKADIILVSRGGGSIEDLWAFNDEAVARAIYQCKTPVVSAVGHETDVVISDFVADVRAPTPSAAAEIISPDNVELLRQFSSYTQWFNTYITELIKENKKELHWLQTRLKRPDHRLREYAQQFDFLTSQLSSSIKMSLSTHSQNVQLQQKRLSHLSPADTISNNQLKISSLMLRLKELTERKLQSQSEQWQHQTHRLHIASPLATLDRGYGIVRNSKNDILHSYKYVKKGDNIKTWLAEGELESKVTGVNKKGLA